MSRSSRTNWTQEAAQRNVGKDFADGMIALRVAVGPYISRFNAASVSRCMRSCIALSSKQEQSTYL